MQYLSLSFCDLKLKFSSVMDVQTSIFVTLFFNFAAVMKVKSHMTKVMRSAVLKPPYLPINTNIKAIEL